METRVDVNENDIVRVKMNDTVFIEVDAYLDRKFKGVVTQIANLWQAYRVLQPIRVTSFQGSNSFYSKNHIKILCKQENSSPFRPGMTTVDIRTQTKTTLTVPIQAVTTRADSLNLNAANGLTEANQNQVTTAEK